MKSDLVERSLVELRDAHDKLDRLGIPREQVRDGHSGTLTLVGRIEELTKRASEPGRADVRTLERVAGRLRGLRAAVTLAMRDGVREAENIVSLMLTAALAQPAPSEPSTTGEVAALLADAGAQAKAQRSIGCPKDAELTERLAAALRAMQAKLNDTEARPAMFEADLARELEAHEETRKLLRASVTGGRVANEERDAARAEVDRLRAQLEPVGKVDAEAKAKSRGPRVSPSFYTLPEVAEVLKVSVSTVRRAVKAGELDVTRVGTLGQIRVSQQALDRYIEQSSDGGALSATASDATQGRSQRQPEVQPSPPPAPSMPPVRETAGTAPNGATWRILNGDVRAALERMKAGSIDCVVTSPPYYWQRDYEVDGQIGHEQTIEGYVEALVAVFRGVQRVLADDGTVFLNLGDTYYSAKGKPHGRDDKHNGRQMMRKHLRAVDGPGLGLPRKSLIGIPWRVALAMQTDGWTLRSAVMWERPGTLPEPTAHDRPWRTYEHVFIFSKGPRYFFDRRGLKGDEDIWRIVARPENPGAHFAPYPRELVQRCLDVGCKPGGSVLDPFVGSGTTMLAALTRKSPATGIDLKPEYCDFIVERIAREFQDRPVNGASRGLAANA